MGNHLPIQSPVEPEAGRAAQLRRKLHVKVREPYRMLGLGDDDLTEAMGVEKTMIDAFEDPGLRERVKALVRRKLITQQRRGGKCCCSSLLYTQVGQVTMA